MPAVAAAFSASERPLVKSEASEPSAECCRLPRPSCKLCFNISRWQSRAASCTGTVTVRANRSVSVRQLCVRVRVCVYTCLGRPSPVDVQPAVHAQTHLLPPSASCSDFSFSLLPGLGCVLLRRCFSSCLFWAIVGLLWTVKAVWWSVKERTFQWIRTKLATRNCLLILPFVCFPQLLRLFLVWNEVSMTSESQLCHYDVTPALRRWSNWEKMCFLIPFHTAKKKIFLHVRKRKYLKPMCHDYICACSEHADRLFLLEKDLEVDFL